MKTLTLHINCRNPLNVINVSILSMSCFCSDSSLPFSCIAHTTPSSSFQAICLCSCRWWRYVSSIIMFRAASAGGWPCREFLLLLIRTHNVLFCRWRPSASWGIECSFWGIKRQQLVGGCTFWSSNSWVSFSFHHLWREYSDIWMWGVHFTALSCNKYSGSCIWYDDI